MIDPNNRPDGVSPESEVINQIHEDENRSIKRRQLIGATMLGLGLALTVAEATDSIPDFKASIEVPFNQDVQNAINAVDDKLAYAGYALLPLALVAVGAPKVAANRSTKAYFIEKESSSEMSDTGKAKRHKILESTFAGSVPVLAAMGAGLATFSSSIGTEITYGPNRPIEAFNTVAPGNTWVVQYPEITPMLESNVSTDLVRKVQLEAQQNGVTAIPFDLLLSNITQDETSRASLTIGAPLPESSPAGWDKADGCENIPVMVDEYAGIGKGETLKLNGHDVQVVDTVEDVSAINRIGVIMSQEAMVTCLKKTENGPVHGIALDTDTATGSAILAEANAGGEVASVVSKEQYLENSETFWEANVKPITNTLSLVSFIFAGAAMTNAMGARLFRNREEWSMHLANGQSMAMLRATELVRAAKDGLAATAIGVATATAATPIVGLTESGLEAGVGPKEMAVGAAVGILGPVGGTLVKVLRLGNVINKSEGTRV